MSDAAKEDKLSADEAAKKQTANDDDNNNNDGIMMVMSIPATADSRGTNEKIRAAYGEDTPPSTVTAVPASSVPGAHRVGASSSSSSSKAASSTGNNSTSKSARRSTEDASADRTDRYLARKAERQNSKDEPASVPGAQRVGASSSSSAAAASSTGNSTTKNKVKNNDNVAHLGLFKGSPNEDEEATYDVDQVNINEDNNNDTTNVPLAAEISDIHEENERLRRELEERNKGEAADIPRAEVMPSNKIPSNVGEDEEDEDEERCRPTKTNIACIVLCFAVILGATIGIVVSANKTEVVVDQGSPQPSSSPTRTQIPSSSPSSTPPWLFVAEKSFSNQVEERIPDEEFLQLLSQSPNKIIWRHCPNCTSVAHQNIYYKRLTDPPSESDLNGEIPKSFLDFFLNNWYSSPKNLQHYDFELYSTYEDALAGTNEWKYCNYDWKKVGFPRECAPSSTTIAFGQWSSFLGNDRYGAGVDHTLYVENKNAPTPPPTPTPPPVDDDDDGVVDDGVLDDGFLGDDFVLPAPSMIPTGAPVPTPSISDIPPPTMVPVSPPTIKPTPYATYMPSYVPATYMPTYVPGFPTAPAPTTMPTSYYPPPVSPPTFKPTPYATPPPTSAAATSHPSSYPTFVDHDFMIDCPEDMIEFEFVIFTDFFGSETTWDLKGANGNIIASGGPFGDFQTVGVGREIEFNPYCIPIDESCYSLTIHDEFGDGIISPGGYRASLGGTVIAEVVGGTKFKTRVIDLARTVENFPWGETFTFQNCEDIPIDSGCYSLEGFMGEEFLGRTNEEVSYSVIIGETFTATNMKTNLQSLVGNFESIDGQFALYPGGDSCGVNGESRMGVVVLVESPQVDSVQTFFSQSDDCIVEVEIRVPVCTTP